MDQSSSTRAGVLARTTERAFVRGIGDIADKVVFERRNEEQAEQILNRLKELCEGSAAS